MARESLDSTTIGTLSGMLLSCPTYDYLNKRTTSQCSRQHTVVSEEPYCPP